VASVGFSVCEQIQLLSIIIVEIKYQQLTPDESQSTCEHQNQLSDESGPGNREQAVDTLPEAYLSGDLFGRGSPDAAGGREVEASWSKARSPDDWTEDVRDYWNSNDKERGGSGEMIVAINLAYDNESDAISSRSSPETVSSVDDAFSKGQSSFAEVIDLSDSEQPPKEISETTDGGPVPTDREADQKLVDRHREEGVDKVEEVEKDIENEDVSGINGNSVERTPDDGWTVKMAVRGSSDSLLAQNVTGDYDKDEVITADLDGCETPEIPSGEMPTPAECSYCVADEALQELDAYLNSVVIADYQQNLNKDILHGSVADDAAGNDDIVACFSSRDDEDIVDTVGTDINGGEDVDQIELTTDHIPMNLCPTKDPFRDADNGSDVGQLAGDGDDITHPRGGNNTASFPENQSPIGMDKNVHHEDFETVLDTNEAAEIHKETDAEDLDKAGDHPGLAACSKSPSQLVGDTFAGPKDKEYKDAVLSDHHSEVLMMESVGVDAELADAEVDAILSRTVGESPDDQDLCRVRCVKVDEVEPADMDSCIQSLDTFSTSELVVSDVTVTSLPETRKELLLSPEGSLEPDSTNDEYDVSGNGAYETTTIQQLSHACTLEALEAEDQSERESLAYADVAGVDQDTQVKTVSSSYLPQSEEDINNNYITKHQDKSDQTSSGPKIFLSVEPSSYEVLDVPNDDDSVAVNMRSENVAVNQVKTTYVSSPGSRLSWYPCSSAVCEMEENVDHIQSESMPNVRGITTSQVLAYRKFRKDRVNVTTVSEGSTLVDSEKMENTAHVAPEDAEDEIASFFVDAFDELPSEKPDCDIPRKNSSSPESSYSDVEDDEGSDHDNIPLEMELKENDISPEEDCPCDGDLDEIGECEPDTVETCLLDVTLAAVDSERSKPVTAYFGNVYN